MDDFCVCLIMYLYVYTQCIRGDICDGDNVDIIIHANKIAVQILSTSVHCTHTHIACASID